MRHGCVNPAAPKRMTPGAARPAARLAALAGLVLLAASLAGCKTDETVTTSTVDYRVRHPIGLVDAPADLDIFLARNDDRLDPRQAHDLALFAADFRRKGRGPMVMMVPDVPGGHRGVGAVRAALARQGISGRLLQVAKYAAEADGFAAPIRLSYAKLQAKVLSECGQWPTDIAGNAASVEGWQNRPYWNLGCAYQTMIANQVDDPVDLVRPRAPTPPDVNRRMKVFDDARKAVDPSTVWKTGTATVGNGAGASGGN